MEYIIIEKKDSDKYVILDERNQGMCCVSKYTLAQLRDDGHIVYGLHSKRGETVKVKDIEILTEQKKPRVNKKVYDVSPSKRSAATVERGLKVSKKKELLRVTKEERDTSGKIITKQMYALPYKDKYMSEIGLVSKSRFQNVSYAENPKVLRVLKNAVSAQERYEKIEEKIKEVTELVPDAFNMKSARIVLAFGEKHDRLWDEIYNVFEGKVPREKIDSFKAGAGTVLFLYDEATVKKMQEQFSTYADNFPVWANQANGMLQLAVWSMLRELNVGASLQHYNPVIDARVKEIFDIPENFKLVAQMPFGGIVSEPDKKEKEDIDKRVTVLR